MSLALLIGALLLPGAPALQTAQLLHAQAELGERAFVTGSPACPRKAKHCFALCVHVAKKDGVPVVDPPWLARHVREANRLFALIDVGFRVVEHTPLDERFATIDTRADRDALEKVHVAGGRVHVYVTGRLADVDIPGAEIRGVHWRVRGRRHHRFVILSKIGPPLVLPHELGHFFGLPHGKAFASLMNKTPRAILPGALTFVPAELAIMRHDRDEMLADRTLAPL